MAENWGIYIHVPWCRRRCPYCDFYFEVGQTEPLFSDHILEEFRARCSFWPREPAATLYFGGGTPSLLPIEEIRTIISQLKERSAIRPDAEVTLEANPEDLTTEFAASLKDVGVTRISLGIQSFEDQILKYLGRKHRSKEAFNAVEACLKAGFERISVDLIFGVPGESSELIQESVRRLSSWGVGHLSAYLLTVEPGTALERLIKRERCVSPDDDDQAEAYALMQSVMERNGYRQYEISSYAVAGQESRHNRNYWGKGGYLGLGPSAHSMRFLGDGRIERSKNASSLVQWKKEISLAKREREELSQNEAMLEAVAFGLRDLVIGIDLEMLAQKHRHSLNDQIEGALQKVAGKGFVMKSQNSTYHLTPLGVRFADAVAREILSLS